MRPFMFLPVATIVLFVATPQLLGQSADWCGFDEQQQVALTEIGGAYMPAFGTIKALMVPGRDTERIRSNLALTVSLI